MTVDAIDLKILEKLFEDGRLSYATIGKDIGLTGPSVYSRVQRLEREGIIKGYTTLLAPEKLGFGLTAFIRVTMQGTAEQEDSFEQFVRKEAQILECYDVDGEDTYLLKVRTASPQMLRQLLIVLRLISGVTRTITTIALGRVKEELASAALLTKTAEARDEQV